tara:strand:- start:61 stop:210 length:150 start_codon:yes stop_codon:yes gene_type:complete
MNLAAGLLFMIWVSIVFVVIGGWAFMEITKQDKSLYSGILDDDDIDSIK